MRGWGKYCVVLHCTVLWEIEACRYLESCSLPYRRVNCKTVRHPHTNYSYPATLSLGTCTSLATYPTTLAHQARHPVPRVTRVHYLATALHYAQQQSAPYVHHHYTLNLPSLNSARSLCHQVSSRRTAVRQSAGAHHLPTRRQTPPH